MSRKTLLERIPKELRAMRIEMPPLTEEQKERYERGHQEVVDFLKRLDRFQEASRKVRVLVRGYEGVRDSSYNPV